MDVVLPCLNEVAALPWVLSRMPPGFDPIVVDNGSTDDSREIARAHGARVVLAPRRGFGEACHAGVMAATSEIVCLMDADASLDPQQLTRVTEPVARRDADLVLGRRRPTTTSAWPLHARWANAALARQLRRRSLDLHDLGPMRAARREALIELGLRDRRSGYALEMVVRASAQRWAISEVDVDYFPRCGKSKVTGTVRGTWRAISDMRAVLADASPC